MVKEQEGVVIDTDGCVAKVKANRHGDCKNCGACPGDSALVLDVRNPIGAKPGQLVVFEMKKSNMLKAAFVVYMMPLISIFLGAMLGDLAANKYKFAPGFYEVAGGALLFALSIIYVKYFDKSSGRNAKMQPVIVRNIS